MPQPSASGKTWLVVGASRGIGYELVRQLLSDGNQVLATVRSDATAGELWPDIVGIHDQCQVFRCDMLDDSSIDTFISNLSKRELPRIDYVVLNAGVLKYPNVRYVVENIYANANVP
jgi:NAD(P)-dependent dehydrogenase (short-subunit alcohol dehydrogenase family)